ncbi:MAG: YbjN domain-containing protein [Caldilineaceae bacterium]|nr:YbjN domain-containing protein [Caldilineaceae bacterium]
MDHLPIRDAFLRFLEESQWSYTQTDDPGLLQMIYFADTASWICYARFREAYGQLVFYSLCPLSVPEPRRPAVAEFITRANYGVMLGAFEMDFEDGEVRCRTGLTVEDVEMSSGLIRPIVIANLAVMARYLPALTAVISSQMTPLDAIREIEGLDIGDPTPSANE